MYRLLASLLLLLNVSTGFAQTTVYHWSSDNGDVNEVGGTVTQHNSTAVSRINMECSGYYVIALLGRAENIDLEDNSQQSQYMEITLAGDETFHAGDVLKFSGMRNCTKTTANVSMYMQFENGVTIKDDHVWNNLGLLNEVVVEGGTGNHAPRYAASGNDLTSVSDAPSVVSFVVPDAADGCKKLKLSRDIYECRLYLSEITVEREFNPIGMRITFKDDTPTANIAFSTMPVMTHSGKNLILSASTVGTFTYDISNIAKVEHVLPHESFPITARYTEKTNGMYYCTFYSGEWSYVMPEGVTAYIAHVGNESIQLEQIDGSVIPSGVAVVMKSNCENYELAMADCATGVQENSLKGVDKATPQNPDLNYYVLSKGQSEAYKDIVGFYRLMPSVDLPANKAYFDLSVSSSARSPYVFPFEDEDMNTDAIVNVKVDEGNSCIYNLKGQRLSTPQRGVNIINGKKVIKK